MFNLQITPQFVIKFEGLSDWGEAAQQKRAVRQTF